MLKCNIYLVHNRLNNILPCVEIAIHTMKTNSDNWYHQIIVQNLLTNLILHFIFKVDSSKTVFLSKINDGYLCSLGVVDQIGARVNGFSIER